MKLYSYYRSSAAYRVRIALALKGAHADYLPVNLLKKENRAEAFAALNPQQLVPALDVGDGVLTQSLAIIEYLDEMFPDPALLPEDPLAKAYARSLALAVACEIHPLNNPRVLAYVTDVLGQSEEAKQAWITHWIREGFAGLEARIAASRYTGAYCVGDRPGLADICLVPQVYNARRYAVDLAPFPNIVRIADYAAQHPAFQAAAPENQPDAA